MKRELQNNKLKQQNTFPPLSYDKVLYSDVTITSAVIEFSICKQCTLPPLSEIYC